MFSRKKEEQPSSPGQQPTSGTSQNPSQSSSLNPSPNTSSPNESEKPTQFQPRTRDIPVVGFRSWNARPFHRVGIGPSFWLGSYNQQYGIWRPGKNNAICYARAYATYPSFMESAVHPHRQTPSANCGCGFYVLTDFDQVPFNANPWELDSNKKLVSSPPMMVGAVVGWGRVIQHETEGWRSQFAQVIALLDCKVSDEHLRVTREVAAAYGVPVLGQTALELLAKEYGDRLT